MVLENCKTYTFKCREIRLFEGTRKVQNVYFAIVLFLVLLRRFSANLFFSWLFEKKVFFAKKNFLHFFCIFSNFFFFCIFWKKYFGGTIYYSYFLTSGFTAFCPLNLDLGPKILYVNFCIIFFHFFFTFFFIFFLPLRQTQHCPCGKKIV